MTQQTNTNPLAKHFRTFRKFVQIPSANTKFLDKESIVFDNEERKEVGVMPMTAADEILFKNPDALLNGEAVMLVIKSCVPAIKDPGKLLASDIDFLLVAIKSVSVDTLHPIEAKCPKCGEENKFEINLDNILSTCKFHDEEYPINLTSGLTAFVRPYIYDDTIKSLGIGFQEAKILEAFQADESVSDSERITRLSEAITKMADLNFDLVTHAIVKVVGDDGELEVTNVKHIEEFSKNMELKDSNLIIDELNRINEIGIDGTFKAVCNSEKCKHEWDSMINYNPTTFFTQPS